MEGASSFIFLSILDYSASIYYGIGFGSFEMKVKCRIVTFDWKHMYLELDTT